MKPYPVLELEPGPVLKLEPEFLKRKIGGGGEVIWNWGLIGNQPPVSDQVTQNWVWFPELAPEFSSIFLWNLNRRLSIKCKNCPTLVFTNSL
jgi:hypothetical protein